MNPTPRRSLVLDPRNRGESQAMTCSVAVASSSPVFSPSRKCSFSLKPASETLALGLTSPPTPASPLCRGRLTKGASGLRPIDKEGFGPSTSGPGAGEGVKVGGGLLKRKRPARIDIPELDAVGFGADGGKCEGAGVDVVEVDTARYSVLCKRGRFREQMEDRYSAAVDIDGDSQRAFFGIFDGHGGVKAADFVANNIAKHVMDEMSNVGEDNVHRIEEAIKNGYLRTDSELLREDVTGGTCSVTAVIRNHNLIVSNTGDCRAVLSRGGTAEALTSDHRPSRADEKKRIELLGGYVDCYHGIWRLQGSLAVSRAIGDAHLKRWVIANPETEVLRIEPEYEFLILASDGLWDKVSNQEAVDIARPICLDSNKSLLTACKKLADLSISRGSVDDVSVMIILLRHFV